MAKAAIAGAFHVQGQLWERGRAAGSALEWYPYPRAPIRSMARSASARSPKAVRRT